MMRVESFNQPQEQYLDKNFTWMSVKVFLFKTSGLILLQFKEGLKKMLHILLKNQKNC